MANLFVREHPIKAFTRFVFFSLLIASISCQQPEDPTPACAEKPAPSQNCEGAGIDVHGVVFGDIIAYSNVSFYRVTSTDFTVVMDTIKTKDPIQKNPD